MNLWLATWENLNAQDKLLSLGIIQMLSKLLPKGLLASAQIVQLHCRSSFFSLEQIPKGGGAWRLQLR